MRFFLISRRHRLNLALIAAALVLSATGVCEPRLVQAEINRAEPPKETKRVKKYIHPCPAGTEQFGEGPPKGGKVFCRQPIIGGYRKQGNESSWFPNGEKRYEGEYVRDQKHGVWKTYHRNGNVKAVEEYYGGKRTKKTTFDRTGKPIEEVDKSKERREKRKKFKWRNNLRY
jgi:hypothetical protein